MLTGSGLTIDTNSIYLVTVGAGAASVSNATGNNGSNSLFSAYSTIALGGGGGGGGSVNGSNINGVAGGSGGGAGTYGGGAGTGGSGTTMQGNAGGIATVTVETTGGGGGAGAAGTNGNGSTKVSGNGGIGLASSISGTSTYYAGGGGGGADNINTPGMTPGSGGTGGGGAGSNYSATPNGTAGTANTGGGGGGSCGSSTSSGAGGSGIVIISYPGSVQQMAGGVVTIVGGNVIHTFTTSGYLTPIKYVSRSLRFRSSASAYLSRTPTVAGNRTTWTWSAWVKRGILGTQQFLLNADNGSANSAAIDFLSDAVRIYFVGGTYQVTTTQVFRDPSAWYHIIFAVDTTQATASNLSLIHI